MKIKTVEFQDWWKDELIRIVSECEQVQHTPNSAYTKQMAKVNAYDDICELLGIEVSEDD